MAPKAGNSKKEAGKARKAEGEQKKKESASAEKERKEADDWKSGAKEASKREAAEEKRKADQARKAENARLLAEEESSVAAVKKPAPKAGAKKNAASSSSRPAGPGAIAAGGGLGDANSAAIAEPSSSSAPSGTEAPEEIESFAATGLDNALDLLEIVTAKTDKASVGQQAAGMERHPERRFKASLAAYEERELPILRKEHPGLRLQQYKDLIYKQFQKAPENPYNQATVAYDATKEEKVDALKAKRAKVEERLRS